MEQKKFDEFYERVTSELIEFMEKEDLNPDNFNSKIIFDEIKDCPTIKLVFTPQKECKNALCRKFMHKTGEVWRRLRAAGYGHAVVFS